MAKRPDRGPMLPGFDDEPELPASPPTQVPAVEERGAPLAAANPPAEVLPWEEAPQEGPPPDVVRHVPPAVEATVSTEPPDLTGKTVWVVDSHSLIHQVFHAIPEMTSPHGEPVAAVFGFTRDLLYLLEDKQPEYLFCAFDLPGPTFRHALYEAYKAGRPELHADLAPQFAKVHRMVEALGIPSLGRPSFEADDLIATLARIVAERGGRCYIVSGDKDCRQLLNDRVTLYNIRKNELIDVARLKLEWGITPDQVVDYQALVGDSSDNVPGVPLVGPKLASDLLGKFGTLDSIYDHVEEVSGNARRENLKKYREQAFLSRQLVRLDPDVPVKIDWSRASTDWINPARGVTLCHEFGFRRLAEKMASMRPGSVVAEAQLTFASTAPEAVSASQAGRPTYHLVDTPEALAALVAELDRQERISVDTETTSIWPRWAELVGISLAWNEREAWYLPVRGPAGDRVLDVRAALDALRLILENPAIHKIGQNLKYDMIVLHSAGVRLAGTDFDTMLASYLLEAGQRNHNLDDLAKRYLNHTTTKISELIGTGKNQKLMDSVPVRQVADYAAEDAWVPIRLRPILAEKLAEANLSELFADVEVPLVEILAEMEYTGIKVDVARLNELSVHYGERLKVLEDEIYQLAGHPFNIASPKQLQTVLFTEQKLPTLKRTAKTGPSTDVDVLEALALQHPLPAKIVEFRQYAKLKGTYVDALPEMVHPTTGRVHASFNQALTATGRLSSSDPNLQNIPVRGEAGREIRSAFVPGDSGWSLVAADYSQIELRILAHYSGDEQLCEAFRRDEDIHARVASQVNNVPLDEVTKAMRRQAKVVNFGVIYGQGSVGLARELGIDREAAGLFIDNYFLRYPGIERFFIETLAECRTKGYVTTILGRRRAIEGIRPGAGRNRNLAERTAVNTVIQGSAADLIKLAMLAIHRRLAREQLPARLLLQIHDELVFEVPDHQVADLAALVRQEMAGVRELAVPLKVDLKAGPNWADVQPLG